MTVEQRIEAYLDRIPPCVAGQGGDIHLFKVACILYNRWALSEADTLRWLRVFNARCEPPWTEDRLVYKAKAAANAIHENPQGHLLGGAFKVEPRPIPNRKKDENPIWAGKIPRTDATAKPKLLQYTFTGSPVNPTPAETLIAIGQNLPLLPLPNNGKYGIWYFGTANTAKSEKSETGNEWKVPAPPPGLKGAERQKFYMDDLRDAIGDEWITAPSGRLAMGRPDPVPRHKPRK